MPAKRKVIDPALGPYKWYAWEKSEAQDWLKDEDYKSGGYIHEANFHTFRQRDVADFEEGKIRTKWIGQERKPAGFSESEPKGRPAMLLLGKLKNPPKDGSAWAVASIAFYHGEEDLKKRSAIRAAYGGGIIETRIITLRRPELRGQDSHQPVIAGHGTVFNQWSDPMGFVEQFAPGSFKRTLKEDLDVRSMFNHDTNVLLGRKANDTLLLEEDKEGLYFEALPPDTYAARDVCTLIAGEYVDQCSIQFICRKDEWSDLEDIPQRTILDADLLETGPVTWAQYPQTDVQLRAFMEYLGINMQVVTRALAKRFAGQPIDKAELEMVQRSIEVMSAQRTRIAGPGEPDEDSWIRTTQGSGTNSLLRRLELLELET